MSSSFISCKVYLKPTDQVRRIQIDANSSMSDFIAVAHELYASNPLQQPCSSSFMISVTYMDEENDWVTVTTEPEWKDALHRHVQLLRLSAQSGATSNLLFRIKCTQIAAKQPQQAKAVGETLCSTACSLMDQVKKGGQHVQPFVEQAKDKTKEKAKKVQEWINAHSSEDLQAIQQSLKDLMNSILDEGSAATKLVISELYKEIEAITSQHIGIEQQQEQDDEEEAEYQLQQSTTLLRPDEMVVLENHFNQQEEEEEVQQQQQQEEDIKEQQEEEKQPEEDFILIENEDVQVKEEPSQELTIEPEEEKEVEEDEEQQQVVVVHEQEEEEEIVESEEEEEEEEVKEPLIDEQGKYAQQMKNLAEMGFTNHHANLQLLIEKNGDIQRVVAELLGFSMN